MAKRTIEANYFADDKDIYDLLIASKQKLTVQKLILFIRKRGIIVSSSHNRDELIEKIASMPLCWQELNELIKATNTSDRAEKIASRSLSGKIDIANIISATEITRDERQNRAETYSIKQNNKNLQITVTYSELDTSKTRLAQRTQKEFTFEIDATTKDDIIIRHQNQPRAQEILDSIVNKIIKKDEHSINQQKIDLSGIKNPSHRTNFFVQLLNGVNGFDLHNVKSVKVSNFSEKNSEDNEDTDNETDNDGIKTEEASFIARVKEIAIKGNHILHSQLYAQSAQDGFFVQSIVWTALEKKPNGILVEFESGFDNPEEGKDFSYAVRGIYNRKNGGDFKKTKTQAENEEKTRVFCLLEHAARNAMSTVLNESQGLSTHDLSANQSIQPIFENSESTEDASISQPSETETISDNKDLK